MSIELLTEKVKGKDLEEFFSDENMIKTQAKFDKNAALVPLDENEDPKGFITLTIEWSEE